MGRCNDWGWRRGVSRGGRAPLVFIALAFMGGCSVQMADGYGERVGGVSGLGNLIEIQKTRHHLLDLMFFGAAVSDHGGLDGEWGVLGDFESGGSSGQHGDTAPLPP